ncbi:Fructosamine/Ketosamine-3-kinase [Microdochium bolleyi]|uniref:protein-ribulosamine 3-kinase n=1 Tax=Microdochium bolleyi TaxID=196109 RepID=A0A136IYB0_9PEZI|nr:Fructosamine/Ketosamine-3-kinase [Microdochium bolleyi]
MSHAERESQAALKQYITNNTVVPTAWGLLASDLSRSFLLVPFLNLLPRCPPPSSLLGILKTLHMTSVSPTGKFGFHVNTFFGPLPMLNDWTGSWEHYYGRQWDSDVKLVQAAHGADAELQRLAHEFRDKVIARLLRPLQTGGRSVRPVLCHGDLWDGNVQVDAQRGEGVLFDGVCFYGHGESEFPRPPFLVIELQLGV